jgi:DNA-binding CsgD family transcriptional regulator
MIDPEAGLLDALYQGVFDVAALDRAVTLLASQLSCASAVFLSIDALTPGTSVLLTSGAFSEFLPSYVSHYGAIDPAPAAFARLPPGGASTTAHMLGAEEHRSAFVNEFYYPAGFVETLGANLISDKARTALIGIHRGADRGPFDDDEIAALERLVPHITRVLQLRRVFVGLEAKANALAATLDRCEAGVVLLDSSGAAIFANSAVRAIASRGDGFALDRSGHPLPVNIEARRRLEELIEAVRSGGAGGALSVPRKEGGRPYAVLVAPSPSPLTEGGWEASGRASILVLVHDPASRPVAAADLLRESLGLPPAAARLVAALAGDDDLQSFAAREGITIHTARFHLRTALNRTGARTQAELVRLAVRLLRDLGLRAGTAPGAG